MNNTGNSAMSEKEDGGPAFPVQEKQADGSHWHSHLGMTLRDYAAIKAMQGLCAQSEAWEANSLMELASVAYTMADAMLAARKEPQS